MTFIDSAFRPSHTSQPRSKKKKIKISYGEREMSSRREGKKSVCTIKCLREKYKKMYRGTPKGSEGN